MPLAPRNSMLTTMDDPANMHLLMLDDEWRPLHRLPVKGDWRAVVSELLRWNSHWLVMEQEREQQDSALPQWSDIHLTRAVSKRLRPIEIALADHIIHSGQSRFSFREAGLL